MSAEKDHRRGSIALQTYFFAQFRGIGIVFGIKIRTQNHAGRQKNMRVVMSHRASLLGGLFRSSYYVLLFEGLNPEPRREICQVGNNRNEGPPGIDFRPTRANLVIEMGNHGDEKVRWILAPIVCKQTHERLVKETDGGL